MCLKGGDANTSFIHAYVKRRIMRNSISAIRVRCMWLERVFEIRQEVTRFYTN